MDKWDSFCFFFPLAEILFSFWCTLNNSFTTSLAQLSILNSSGWLYLIKFQALFLKEIYLVEKWGWLNDILTGWDDLFSWTPLGSVFSAITSHPTWVCVFAHMAVHSGCGFMWFLIYSCACMHVYIPPFVHPHTLFPCVHMTHTFGTWQGKAEGKMHVDPLPNHNETIYPAALRRVHSDF